MKLSSDSGVWIWRGILPQGGSVLFYGDAKVGKSKLALSLAEAIADPTKSQYLNIPIDLHGRVLYFQLDTPRNLWKDGYIKFLKFGPAYTSIYIIDREMPELPILFDIRNKEHLLWLRAEVDAINPVLVIIDTIRRTHKGNENESDTMALVLDNFIAATKPAALLILSHKKKAQQGDSGEGTARGSTALSGAVDALVNMSKTKLFIEARSDVEPEISIFQHKDGTWDVNSKEDAIADFLEQLSPGLSETARDAAICEAFGVSPRTARTWKKAFGKPKE